MKIYELNSNINELLEKYYNCFDEDWVQIVEDFEAETIRKTIEELENQKDDLKKWILEKMQNDKWDIEKINNEIQRLSEIKTTLSKKVIKWENFAKFLFWELDKNIIFESWKIWYRKSSSVKLDDNFDVKEYINEKITYSPDKTKIKNDLKIWKEILWAIIEDKKTFFIK